MNSSAVTFVIVYPLNTVINKMIRDGTIPTTSVSIVNSIGFFVGYVRSRTKPETTERTKNVDSITKIIIPKIKSLEETPNSVRI